MVSACAPIDSDAALLQQLAEEARTEVGRVFDGQRFAEAGIVLRDVPPKGELAGARFAIDGHRTRAGALRRSHYAVIDFVVLGKRRDAEKRTLAGTVGRLDVYEDDVVINSQRGNRGAPLACQVVLRPAFAVALEDEV